MLTDRQCPERSLGRCIISSDATKPEKHGTDRALRRVRDEHRWQRSVAREYATLFGYHAVVLPLLTHKGAAGAENVADCGGAFAVTVRRYFG